MVFFFLFFKARENTPQSLMFYEFTKLLYPGGNISYNMQVHVNTVFQVNVEILPHSYLCYKFWQTGGKLKNLRETTSIENIRAYHEKYYRTENMHVTIAGRVPPKDLFKALDG